VTAEAAFRAHAGEAAVSKTRFEKLPPTQRQQLLDFLNSLQCGRACFPGAPFFPDE